MKNFLLILLGLAVGLVLAETVLRSIDRPRFHTAHTAPAQFHFRINNDTGDFFYVNTPATTLRFGYDSNPRGYFGPGNSVDHTVNGNGFRGAELPRDKPPDTLHLAFLGDSFTFGEGVRDEDTFSARTAEALSKQLADRGVVVRGINFGVGGYNLAQSRFLLETIALQSRPDAVVLTYVLNDAEASLFEIDSASGQPLRRARQDEIAEGLDAAMPPDELIYASRIAQALWQLRSSLRRGRQTEAFYRGLYEDDREAWRSAQAALLAMGRLLRERNIPFYVMIFPILHELDADHPFEALYDRVAARAHAAGATVLPLLPAFRGRSGPDLWVHPTDQHPNEDGHRIATTALVNLLRQDPAFTKLVQRAAASAQPPSP